MTDRYAKLSFLASGHVIQDVLITAPHITPSRLQIMLDDGEAVTTVQEGKHVCVTTGDWLPIAEVIYVEAELEYKDFILEDTYNMPTPPVPETFDATRMALAGAIGEYIDEPEMSAAGIMRVLEHAGDKIPALNVVEHHEGLTGWQLQKDINLTAIGLISLMQVAYAAGTAGKELI